MSTVPGDRAIAAGAAGSERCNDRPTTPSFELSVAPMMERTDRHFRYLMRLVSPRARLYTEMITAVALLHGDARKLLAFDPAEHPVAAQLGGAEPKALASAARLVADAGYDEVNLNVGCPSSRVQAGEFGARLMLAPARVAECVAAMGAASRLPVTVKTRIGVDDHDDFDVLRTLTAAVASAGAGTLIVHARKAWLSGLSPRQNREIPPLDYPRVHRLKAEFPDLRIVINGGFATESGVLGQVGKVDGVMLGRAAYNDPLFVGRVDRELYRPGMACTPSAAEVLQHFGAYMRRQQRDGTPLKAMTRHLMGLCRNQHGAKRWRRCLGELSASEHSLDDLMAQLAGLPTVTRYNAGRSCDSATLSRER